MTPLTGLRDSRRGAPARHRPGRTRPDRGYARASTARQSLDTQIDSLTAAGVGKVFAEKVSTRAAAGSELDAAVRLARDIRASGVAVTLVVTGAKKGQHSSPATVMRMLRDLDNQAPTPAAQVTGRLLFAEHSDP